MKYLMNEQIKVIDDIVNKEIQENIKHHLLFDSNFDWHYTSDVNYVGQNQNRPGFYHYFHKPVLPIPIITNACSKISYAFNNILQVRAFLQLPLNQKFIGTDIDSPHIDLTTKHIVILYYVNDSDGHTILYDKLYDEQQPHPKMKDLKIVEKVLPKQGRCVIFDGLRFHTGEQPQNNVRCIINCNID